MKRIILSLLMTGLFLTWYPSTTEALTKEQALTLKPNQIELIEWYGSPKERQQIRKWLTNSVMDPATLGIIVSTHLTRGEWSAARYWIRYGIARGLTVPAELRLQMALFDLDTDTVTRLLSELGDKLSPATRVESLTLLGRNRDALSIAQDELDTNISSAESNLLANQADSLAMMNAQSFDIERRIARFGDLDMTGSIVTTELNTTYMSFQARIAKYTLFAFTTGTYQFADESEYDLSFTASGKHGRQLWRMQTGGSVRKDDSLVFGEAAWGRTLSLGGQALLNLRLNKPVQEGMMRAIGIKDAISFSLALTPNRWEFLNLEIQNHRYRLRNRDEIADGYALRLLAGRYITQELPRWNVSLQLDWEDNEYSNTVKRFLSDPSPFVSTQYGFAGVSSQWQYGMANVGPMRRLSAALSVTSGLLWQEKTPVYSFRLSLGTSIFARDSLSLNAWRANTASGFEKGLYYSYALSYRYWF